MQSYEVNLMSGMIDVLNRSLEKPILSPERYKERLEDLRQFEHDINFMFANSPNCPLNVQSVVEVITTENTDVKECNNIEDIIEFANQKDMLIYADVCGVDMSITYTDGILTKIIVNNVLIDVKKINNIPYKINMDGVYTVQGRMTTTDKVEFIVYTVIRDGSTSIKEDLDKAKDLGFNVIPNWSATNFNPKNLQGSIDYVFEYMSDEDAHCKGVVFRFNNIENEGCIIYRRNTSDEE